MGFLNTAMKDLATPPRSCLVQAPLPTSLASRISTAAALSRRPLALSSRVGAALPAPPLLSLVHPPPTPLSPRGRSCRSRIPRRLNSRLARAPRSHSRGRSTALVAHTPLALVSRGRHASRTAALVTRAYRIDFALASRGRRAAALIAALPVSLPMSSALFRVVKSRSISPNDTQAKYTQQSTTNVPLRSTGTQRAPCRKQQAGRE